MSQTAEQAHVVSLTRITEDGYAFSILLSFEYENEKFLLARSDNFPGQIFIVAQQGDQMIPLVDETKRTKLLEHLERIKAEMPAVTVADAEGIQHVFQIVRQLEHEGQTYQLGLDVEGGTELVVFQNQAGKLNVVTDEALLNHFLDKMQAFTSGALAVTVQNANGERHVYTVVGQLEINDVLYVLAASNAQDEELIVLRQDGEQLSVVTDPDEVALVNQHLRPAGR